MDRNLDKIREKIGEKEILAQLQEEASELAVAASKLRRALGNDNPTPVSIMEAVDMVLEEIADVSLCIRALHLNSGMERMKVMNTMTAKAERWAQRVGVSEEARTDDAEQHQFFIERFNRTC